VDLASQLSEHLCDTNEAVRLEAAISGVIFNSAPESIPESINVLKQLVLTGKPDSEQFAWFATLRMDEHSRWEWIHSLSTEARFESCALRAIMASGDVRFIPSLLEAMDNPQLCRLAGEAFSSLTGCHIEQEHLSKDSPSAPTPNPRDADLPDPDPTKVADWWNERRDRFPPVCRYFLGRPVDDHSLQDALRTANQAQRADAAILRSCLCPQQPLWDVRAPGFRQKRSLPDQ
jgi:uncharacterized protein (TIGR02270 family)